MRFLILAFVTAVFVHTSNADAAQTVYFVGESIVTSVQDASVTRNPYIVARTTDSAAGTIVEVVVSKQGAAYAENTSTMKISGNQLTMTVSTGTITGDGSLTGPAWNWTFLRAEFHMTSPAYSMRIVDYNFLAEPGSILGHKDFYLTLKATAGERFVQQEDVILHSVDQATFVATRAKLLGH